MELSDFYNEFLQDIRNFAGDNGFLQEAFTESISEILISEGIIQDFQSCGYINRSKGLAIDGWNFNRELGRLALIISCFSTEALLAGDQIPSLTKTDIDQQLKRLRKLYEQCGNKQGFVDKLEPAEPIAEFAHQIYELQDDVKIQKIELIVLSNSVLSKRIDAIDSSDIEGIDTTVHVIDLNRIKGIIQSSTGSEDITIRFNDYGFEGLPCLPASSVADKIASYLFVMPGSLIADLYDRYHDRLLEQNVRTFLQFRGKVNRGMRNTVKNQPEYFFAYNNGLTTTASDIVIEDGQIKELTNLQIVNGGQTTASIFNSHKADRVDLSNVHVQVKLSVINETFVDELVPKISEYSNTQNKVNVADFFSNHPFHVKIEEISRRLVGPNKTGGIDQTKWFYERARGQYANEQSRRSQAEKKKFLLEYPKSQYITKTDLAKYVLTFEQQPHVVSKGAQAAFSGTKNGAGFVQYIEKHWNKNENQFNDLWFKNAMSKAFLFRQLDKLVYSQEWYRGYKINIITYSLAKFVQLIEDQTNLQLDYNQIWQEQALPDPIVNQLLYLATYINDTLVSPPEGQTSNISQWAKTEHCWKTIKELDLRLNADISPFLIDPSKIKEAQKVAVTQDKDFARISGMEYVLNKGSEYWLELSNWHNSNPCISPTQKSIMLLAARNPVISDKQATLLIKAEKTCIDRGFFNE